ncbi:MAG: peptidase M14, partial [Haliscomenobacter sp.]
AALLDKLGELVGTLITFDESSDLAIELFGLPVRNVTNDLSSQQFFIPGSLVRVKVNTNSPLAWGMQSEIAAFYDHSRAFEVYARSYSGEGGEEKTARVPETVADVVVNYASKDILMSGWANGADRYLKDKAALVQVPYGKGSVVLFGFPPQFRGQPRASYKLIFNGLFQAAIH